MAQDTSSARNMDDTHSIIQFLQRPALIENIEIVAGTTNDRDKQLRRFVLTQANAQPFIQQWDLPSAVLKTANKGQKIANFKYLRCDIKVKIVLNANPFIAGRLFLTYSPYDDKVSVSRRIINTSRAGVTAYPGIELDFQIDNSVEMTIPYASFQEAYDIVSGTEDFVNLYLFALTPILGPPSPSANSKVDLSVYMWLDNISLVIPTYRIDPAIAPRVTERVINQYIPHPLEKSSEDIRLALSRLQKKSKASYDYIISALSQEVPDVKNVKLQGNNKKPTSENPKVGPISEVASGVKSVANGIERLPIVGEIAKPVTAAVKWFADIVGGVAAVFGWSKPKNQEQVCAYQNTPGWGMSLYKGIDMSVPLAYDPNNELGDAKDVFPSGVDEMALGYVCANPGIKSVLSWKTTDLAGYPIKGEDWGSVIPVGMPCHTKTIKTVKGTTSTTKTEVMDPVPCEYVSQMFSYWRATMCFKIAVVKTAFHTGRLEIFYEPGDVPNSATAENIVPDFAALSKAKTNSDNNYKYILDLTNDTEVTIRIPYVSNKMFMKTNGIFGANSENTWDFSESFTGFLCIRPVTKLMAPDTVSDNVSIIVWKWAEDVALVEPRPLISHGTKIFSVTPKLINVDMQINLSTKTENNSISFFNTDSATNQNNIALMKGSGEQVVNLRTLLRTFRCITDSWTLPANKKTKITDITDIADEDGRDYMSYLSFMYRFYRGGRRYKFYDLLAKDNGFVQSTLIPRNTKQDPTNNDGPTHITYPKINPVHEVEIPFYSQYRKIPIASTTDQGYDASLALEANIEKKFKVFRAGNDDFTYGWLVGTPQTEGITFETAN